ncbi:MAG: hypothetical protein LBR07_08715 [Puniceicoccales bacterium]|jgi:hypothetical protein|nr:hypothetical protein [Puniceicoccales bacterium]
MFESQIPRRRCLSARLFPARLPMTAAGGARRAATLVKVVVIAAAAVFAVVLIAGSVMSGLRLKTERDIRANLQTVWIEANRHFLETGAEDVGYDELGKNPVVAQLRAVDREDYSRINDGKRLSRTEKTLTLKYGAKKKSEVVYETP